MSDDKTIIADPGNLTIFNPSKRNKASLVQYSGSKLGKHYPLDQAELIVGRGANAQIVIAEASVSRQHAKFKQKGGDVEVEDLGSANGTFVNDERVKSRKVLKDGDILRLGTILLKYFAHDNIDGMIQDKIYRMATIDAGTQIFNKQYLMDSLRSEIKHSISMHRKLSIIYYDLDHFKKVNDNFGHNNGDIILRETAAIVKAAIRKDDIIGRFGGEEFVIILPGTDKKVAFELAERIRLSVANKAFLLSRAESGGKVSKIKHRQTVSVGVAELTQNMQTAEDLLEKADRKLYESKKTGRNRVSA